MNIQVIIELNKNIVKLKNEPFGFVSRSNLEFALSEFNFNKRLSFFEKLAVLIRGIAQGHPFTEGNKRTTYMVLQILLTMNNMKWKTTKKQQEDFIVRIAKGRYNNISKLSKYIIQHTK